MRSSTTNSCAVRTISRRCALASVLGVFTVMTIFPSAAHEAHTAAAEKPAAAAGSGMPKRRAPPIAIGAAFAPNGVLWIVGLDDTKKLFVQTSTDDGKRWSLPRVLNTGNDKIAADGENRPKIAFGKEQQVVITYTEPLAKPYSGRIRMLRSADAGATFSSPFTVHQDTQEITHRFESVAFDNSGVLHTAWVDKRDLEAAITADAGASSKKNLYRGAAIYRNESRDGGRTFGPDIKLADHSCECCRIALASSPDGGMVAMWRHVFEPNERDHAFAPLQGGANNALTRATFDHWAIDACPHHGPGLAPDAEGGYHAVWFGIRNGAGRVRYGKLAADGSPRGEVRELPDERAEHATISSEGKLVVIPWRSFDGKATNWRAWVSADNGNHFVLRELGRSADENDHPLLARRDGRIFALWRTTQGIQVEEIAP